jgi:hypothetical protein
VCLAIIVRPLEPSNHNHYVIVEFLLATTVWLLHPAVEFVDRRHAWRPPTNPILHNLIIFKVIIQKILRLGLTNKAIYFRCNIGRV